MARTFSEEKGMNRMFMRAASVALALAVFLRPIGAEALEVFACEPEWAALASELGGDKVEVFSATTARQDPHQIQARPALIARLRSADLVVCTGAELEIGWMPMLLRQAANARVQPGTPGYLEAAQYVRLLEKPTRLDRAEGDIHPAGNPHIQTDPRNIAAVSAVLARRLSEIDPADSGVFGQRSQSFTGRWNTAMQRWAEQAAPLRGTAIATYHKGWAYLEDWLGLREAGTVEPKPGIPPGSQYLAQLVTELPARGVRGILYAAYEDPRASEFVAERIHVAAIMLPYTVGGSERARDLFGVFDDTIERLSRGLAGGASANR
jgi:zinc/manganese transport system substrate-binding protein